MGEDVEMTEMWMRRMNVKAKLTQYCHHSQDRLSEDRPHVSRELNLNLATMITVNDEFLLAARAPVGSNEVSMMVNVESCHRNSQNASLWSNRWPPSK